MTKDEALRIALEALEKISRTQYHIETPPIESLEERMRRIADQAITASKAALEAKVEPERCTPNCEALLQKVVTQRTWVGLTYEDMVKLQKDLYDAKGESVLPTTFAMAVEAKLKEKNCG
jgi:hypothetical protein